LEVAEKRGVGDKGVGREEGRERGGREGDEGDEGGRVKRLCQLPFR